MVAGRIDHVGDALEIQAVAAYRVVAVSTPWRLAIALLTVHVRDRAIVRDDEVEQAIVQGHGAVDHQASLNSEAHTRLKRVAHAV